jgi:hypothetical protein
LTFWVYMMATAVSTEETSGSLLSSTEGQE